MSYLSIEAFLINFLNSRLEVAVSGDIPTPRPPRFVTLEQTGSRTENYIYHTTLAVQAWAKTRADAGELIEEVKAAMAKAIEQPKVSSCKLETDYYFPELETKSPRYQAIFQITYL